MQPLGVMFFGKIPSAGDYVRHALDTPTRRSLFDWFVDGWNRSVTLASEKDIDSPTRLLIADPAAERAVALLLHPSRDKVGRRFPLVIGAEMALAGATIGEAVWLAEGWLQRAESIAQTASRGLDCDTVRAHVDGLRGIAEQPRLATLHDWRDANPVASLPLDAEATPTRWLRGLAFARSTIDMPEYVVRGESAASIDALAATIDLGDRLGRQPVRAVGYRIEPGCAAKWQLLCDQLAPRYLRPMVWHDAASESAWDLTRELDKVPETFVSPVVDDVAATTTVQQVLEAADDGHR
ncbi:MAG: type VI secretion system-associated protein TagF [Planctomycetes bacterium]|nr:type VI secretion system-associated protein TagF [Planctomycetota bacterium]